MKKTLYIQGYFFDAREEKRIRSYPCHTHFDTDQIKNENSKYVLIKLCSKQAKQESAVNTTLASRQDSIK